MPVKGDVNIEELSKKTEGYSGAEISLICREAGLNALNTNIGAEVIEYEDFLHAIQKVKPRINQQMLM